MAFRDKELTAPATDRGRRPAPQALPHRPARPPARTGGGEGRVRPACPSCCPTPRRRHPAGRLGGAAPGRGHRRLPAGVHLVVGQRGGVPDRGRPGSRRWTARTTTRHTSSAAPARRWAASGSWGCWSTSGPPGSGTCSPPDEPEPDRLSGRHASGRAGGPLMGDFDFFVGHLGRGQPAAAEAARRLRRVGRVPGRLGGAPVLRRRRQLRRDHFPTKGFSGATVRIFDPARRSGRSTG